MALSKSESDIILNRANVALSRSQRLVSSWLPAETETTPEKTEEELQREEDEIFIAVPETLGIGAPLPEKAADGSWNRTELGTNDLLRKQLLGRNYDRIMKEKAAAQKPAPVQRETGQGQSSISGQAQGTSSSAVTEEEDDEEEGRAAMVGKKRKKDLKENFGENGSGSGSGSGVDGVTGGKGKGRKKAASYLDEILAQRASKKKKR
ncbi:uncharacterized protein N7469_008834 [Penicillium citrinum]|uniref:Uncharacterized protein n=1 Tax=Penicillium citrinum TaxID=5077 RepID=A0A9W9NQ00_PENCI|nr:uncharacterized protein N7469_008834 [Penicillium citrinum]KAJ5222594.1 hypothetical protein N7469_008834 [Penicillium citrinum]